MMFNTKNKSAGPCSFGHGDFLQLHFLEPIFDTVTYLCNKWNGLNNFGRVQVNAPF